MKKSILFAVMVSALLFTHCTNPSSNTKSTSMLDSAALQKAYDTVLSGKKVGIYFLRNTNQVEVAITNFGGRIVALVVPDKQNKPTDIVLGYNQLSDYLTKPEAYFGALIGRYGNRIAKGQFRLNDSLYQLATNNGPNALHGGPMGFHNQVWNVERVHSNELVLSYLSKDGEEGYPGNLQVQVTYTLTDSNELKINYQATTDKATVVNLTNHAYFNLNGQGNPSITDHELTILATQYSSVDSTLIPIGAPVPVKGTPFDFTTAKLIGKDIAADDAQIKNGLGYDHNFVLDKKTLNDYVKAAIVYAPSTGIQMEVFTTEPAIQFYSGNFLDGSLIGKNNQKYPYRSAFCLETQHYPDSPNQSVFPSTQLLPGQTLQSTTVYTFGVKK